MVVSVCSPLLYILFKYTKLIGVVLLTICYITGVFVSDPGFSAMAFLFFGAGGYCRINNIDTTKAIYNYRKLIYVLAAVLWIVCTMLNGHNTKQGDIVYPFYVILGVMATINIATYLVDKRKVGMPVLFSKASFFIYLLHTILIIDIITKVSLLIFGERNLLLMTISYLSVPITTVAVCIVAYYALNKYSPSLLRVSKRSF